MNGGTFFADSDLYHVEVSEVDAVENFTTKTSLLLV